MSSSSLTSVSINKNKSRFAPKVKARPPKRSQGNDNASTSSSSTATTAEREATAPLIPTANIGADSEKIKETLRRLSSGTLPDVTNLSDSAHGSKSILDVLESFDPPLENTTQSSSKTSTSTASSNNKRKSNRRTSTTGTPIVPGSSSGPSSSSNSNSNGTTTTSKTKRSVPVVIPEPGTPGTPGTPYTPTPTTPHPSDLYDDIDVESNSVDDDVRPSPPPPTQQKTTQISKKNMSNIRKAMKEAPKSTTGNSFTAPSNATPAIISAPSPKHKKEEEEYNQLAEFDSADDEEGVATTTAQILASKPGQRRRRRQRKATVDDDDGDDYDNKPKERRKRGRTKETPLLAKDMKTLDDITSDPILPGTLDRSVAYFLKDRSFGVVTKQFRDEQIQREQDQLQRDEEEAAKTNDQDTLGRLAVQKQELQQRKEKDEALLAKKAEEEEQRKQQQQQQQNQGGLTESSHAPQLRMINGKIILDTDSLQIDRERDHEKISYDDMEVVEENAQSKKINSATYGKSMNNARWSTIETDLFYELLSQFGTDFEMISQMVPNRTRTQVRHKFVKEERTNPKKVTEYMIRKRKPLDLESFKKMTGLDFDAVPDDFHSIRLS